MSTRALHPCATPGCATLVRASYCPEHEATRRHVDPEQARFYRSSWWTKRSKAYRSQHPVCEACSARPSKFTDHRDGDWQNNAWENYQALCVACNRTKTAKQHRSKVGGVARKI